MNPLHIAFFNRSFHPDTAATGQLLTELCEGLVRDHGCKVSVVAGLPPIPPQGNRNGVKKGPLFPREHFKGIEGVPPPGTRFFKRGIRGGFAILTFCRANERKSETASRCRRWRIPRLPLF